MATKRKPASAVGEIQSDLYALREDVGRLADQVTELLSDKGDDVLTDVKRRVGLIRETIDSAISEVGTRGLSAARDAKDGVKDGIESIGDTVEESVREHPFTMLALAVGLGVVVGTTLRR